MHDSGLETESMPQSRSAKPPMDDDNLLRFSLPAVHRKSVNVAHDGCAATSRASSTQLKIILHSRLGGKSFGSARHWQLMDNRHKPAFGG